MNTFASLIANCPTMPPAAVAQLWTKLDLRERTAYASQLPQATAEVIAACEPDHDVLRGLLRAGMDAQHIITTIERPAHTNFMIRYICEADSRLDLVTEHLANKTLRSAMWKVFGSHHEVMALADNVELSTLLARHAPTRVLMLQEPALLNIYATRRLADHPDVVSALLDRLAQADNNTAWDLAFLVASRTPYAGVEELIATSLPATPWRNALTNWAAGIPWDPAAHNEHGNEKADRLSSAVLRRWILAGPDLSIVTTAGLDDLSLYGDCSPQEIFHNAVLSKEQRQHLLLAFPPRDAHVWLEAHPTCDPLEASSAFRAMIGTGTTEDDFETPVSNAKAAALLAQLPLQNRIAVMQNIGPWLAQDLLNIEPVLKQDLDLLVALPVNLTLTISSTLVGEMLRQHLGEDPHTWSVFAAVADANQSLSLSDAIAAALQAFV